MSIQIKTPALSMNKETEDKILDVINVLVAFVTVPLYIALVVFCSVAFTPVAGVWALVLGWIPVGILHVILASVLWLPCGLFGHFFK